jgi:chloride channel protein, CIC family
MRLANGADQTGRSPLPLVRAGEPRLLLESLILGVLGALSAQVFTWMLKISQDFFLVRLAHFTPPALPTEGGIGKEMFGLHSLILLPAITTLGGLLAGLLVYTLAPEAEGHGTDAAVAAFHQRGGYIRAIVAPVKMVASAITIGSGGSAGREGPIALITGGIGSIYATIFHRPEEERRFLLLVGMAAGLSAIFRSPIGTSLFAIEVLYGGLEFETNALLYTMLSSATAYAVNGVFVGWKPLFRIPPNLTTLPSNYPWYFLLGIAAGLIATLVPVVFYGVRDLFRMLPIPRILKPAIGGLLTGLIALRLPQVLGGGYSWMQAAMDGRLALGLLLILPFAKLLSFAFTVSSGGSGGVFAPTLFVGAMVGGVLAPLLHQPTTVFVIVGMAAVFGAAARVPVASMLMVTEMSGGYHLLVPAGVGVMVAYLIQVRLAPYFKYRSLYEAQVPTRADSPALYAEHVRLAISLLGRRSMPGSAMIGSLDLMKLLESRVRFALPGGKQLSAGILQPKSDLAGKSIQHAYDVLPDRELEIVAVVREGHVILPHPYSQLRPGDEILAITTPESRKLLMQHFSPLTSTAAHEQSEPHAQN